MLAPSRQVGVRPGALQAHVGLTTSQEVHHLEHDVLVVFATVLPQIGAQLLELLTGCSRGIPARARARTVPGGSRAPSRRSSAAKTS